MMAKEVICNMDTDKPQASQTKKYKSISNEANRGTALNNQVHWIIQGLLEELKHKTQ